MVDADGKRGRKAAGSARTLMRRDARPISVGRHRRLGGAPGIGRTTVVPSPDRGSERRVEEGPRARVPDIDDLRVGVRTIRSVASTARLRAPALRAPAMWSAASPSESQ
jgi:hypothetical protein